LPWSEMKSMRLDALTRAWTVARLTIQETQRRKILRVGWILGVGFLTVFGLGFHFIYRDLVSGMGETGASLPVTFLTMAGLYAVNFIVIVVSVLISVASLSGEIDSHTIDLMLAKPIRRWEIVIGKWWGFALVILAYLLLLAGGLLLIVYLIAGSYFKNAFQPLAIMYLEGLIMMSLSLAGGSRLPTLANGALAFMLYGMAFIGGWVEQIGAMLRNEIAVDIGIAVSLLLPVEAMWRKASVAFEPRVVSNINFAGPFGVASQPSPIMLYYAGFYLLLMVGFAIWSFNRRDL